MDAEGVIKAKKQADSLYKELMAAERKIRRLDDKVATFGKSYSHKVAGVEKQAKAAMDEAERIRGELRAVQRAAYWPSTSRAGRVRS